MEQAIRPNMIRSMEWAGLKRLESHQPVMTREPVSSSSLVDVGYDPVTRTLEVGFKNGRIYQYFDVPEHIHGDLMNAGSPGGYLSSEVKGKYRYARV